MTPESYIPKPTLQTYVALDPMSVSEYRGIIALTTVGGGPQSATKENRKPVPVCILTVRVSVNASNVVDHNQTNVKDWFSVDKR